MANTSIESTIQSIIARGSSEMAREIVRAVRQTIAAEIAGSQALAAAISPPKRRGAAPRAGRQAAVAAAPKPAGKPRKVSKFKRRSSDQIVRDNQKLLAFVKDHPGLRSEDIGKALKLAKPNLAAGLQRLREEGRLRMKGVKRAATYSAA
jgi:hypothetical protein